MQAAPVSVILIQYGPPEWTVHVAGRLRDTCGGSLREIIIVDNGTGAALERCGADRIVRLRENSGYAAACNAGAAAAGGPVLAFLNNDLDFDSDWITPLVSVLSGDASIGAIGPKLLHRDGRFQLSWGDRPGILNDWRERRRQREARAGGGPHSLRRSMESMRARDVDWLTGAAVLVRSDAFAAVGGFDEGFFFYFEDVDLCARLRSAGYRLRYEPASVITHFGGGSTDGDSPLIRRAWRDGQLRYYGRHADRISFAALKLYLSSKIMLTALQDRDRMPEARALIRRVLAASVVPPHPSSASSATHHPG